MIDEPYAARCMGEGKAALGAGWNEPAKAACDESDPRNESQRIVASCDDTAARIGRDLHDGVGPLLAGIGLLARGLVPELPPAQRAEGSRLLELVAEASALVHQLARGLMPVEVDTDWIDVALEELVSRYRTLLRIECNVDFVHLTAPRPVIAHLGMIVREAIVNASRHGRASTVWVKLSSDGDVHILAVEDDGLGFRGTSPSRAGLGLGLVNMRLRAEAIAGTLDVAPRNPKGTVVRCAWRGSPESVEKITRAD